MNLTNSCETKSGCGLSVQFVSIHVYIIGTKFGGKILTFTEVMSCRKFGAIFPMEKLCTKKALHWQTLLAIKRQ